jgi:TolB-like protein/Tfp pilus assembly protein PilF
MSGMRRPQASDGGGRPAESAKLAADRLGSWKEIAAYLRVTARTAQRWERLEGLPVHRQMHATLGSAYALPEELEAWRASRRDPSARVEARPRANRSIAVLPFANLTRDLATEILADGLTEELISTLAQVPGLRVVARTSAFYFKDKNVDIRDVGATLGVDTVLEGSVRNVGGRIRVVAQLIDAQTGLHLWSEPFENGRTDLLGLQRDLAHAVAGTLRATLGGPKATIDRREEWTAYGRYLEGMYYWNRRTPAGFLRAIECFERAVADDPALAVAWSALAGCYSNAIVTTTMPLAQARENAMRFAQTALERDPTLAEAEVWLGSVAALFSHDWDRAQRHFLRANELKPNLAAAHLFYAASVLAPTGRFAEAEAHQELAHKLDPLSAVVINATGMLRLMLRQYDRSAAAFRATLELDSEYPWAHRGLAEIAVIEGRYEAALSALRRVEMPSLAAGLVGIAQARLGAEDEARLGIRRLEQSGDPGVAYQIAMIRMALGDADGTFDSLHRACAEHDVGSIWLAVDPIWDPVRRDERFRRVVLSMGLDPVATGKLAGRG